MRVLLKPIVANDVWHGNSTEKLISPGKSNKSAASGRANGCPFPISTLVLALDSLMSIQDSNSNSNYGLQVYNVLFTAH